MHLLYATLFKELLWGLLHQLLRLPRESLLLHLAMLLELPLRLLLETRELMGLLLTALLGLLRLQLSLHLRPIPEQLGLLSVLLELLLRLLLEHLQLLGHGVDRWQDSQPWRHGNR